jgi:hypothetical protein
MSGKHPKMTPQTTYIADLLITLKLLTLILNTPIEAELECFCAVT